MPITQQIQMAYGVAPGPPTASLWAWGEPSLEGLANNDPISTITDQTGNGRNWTSTGSNRPLYKVNIFNSSTVGAALLDGSDDFFNTADASALTAIHMFQVVQLNVNIPVAAAQTGFHTWSTESQAAHYPFTDGLIYDSFGTTSRKTSLHPGNMAVAHVYDVFSGASLWENRFNGTVLTSTGTNTVGISATAKWGQNLNSDNLDGYMGGLYIYSGQVTGSTRTSLINYINTKFGTSST